MSRKKKKGEILHQTLPEPRWQMTEEELVDELARILVEAYIDQKFAHLKDSFEEKMKEEKEFQRLKAQYPDLPY